MRVIAFALISILAGCDHNSSGDRAEDRTADTVHEITDEQFKNISDQLANMSAQMNEMDANVAELRFDADKQKQHTDQVDSRVSTLEQKTERLP